MITARLLNQDASLNNYQQIGGISFVNGDTIRVAIQLFNEELGVRHIPSSAATVMLGVNFSDNTFATISPNSSTADSNLLPMVNTAVSPATSFDSDRSIWYVDIITNNAGAALATPLTGKTLVGGNVIFVLTDDDNSIGSSKEGIIFNALQRVIVS